jgi:hypothetical protein
LPRSRDHLPLPQLTNCNRVSNDYDLCIVENMKLTSSCSPMAHSPSNTTFSTIQKHIALTLERNIYNPGDVHLYTYGNERQDQGKLLQIGLAPKINEPREHYIPLVDLIIKKQKGSSTTSQNRKQYLRVSRQYSRFRPKFNSERRIEKYNQLHCKAKGS